ncbi:MAG: DUF1956 domain-containing protein [Planctomycetota bacterium]|nr:MAG: DUF1956 domain-containing protein [Planctomycetota bacterium]REJ96262.1 MAG: DUF1956 domain-containing protein [Planctomycetota bacterium]REK22272.1 MAG: DUF1956 domain-containing protein [Planctomycetota bacterium]REK27454.1 MAG: DUF1956 domain-containing protein [Planctomycetota bacterium]
MSDDTRTRILEAAGPIFARKGIEGATIREICHAAAVNVAAVNYHFGDKESLYLEAVRLAHRSRTRHAPPESLIAAATAEERLASFIRMSLRRMLTTPEHDWQTGLLLREMLEPTNACRTVVEEFIRPNHEMLLSILTDLVPPETPAHRLEKIALSIIGQCMLYRVAREFVGILIPQERRDAEFRIDQIADHITEFSTAAIATMSRTEQAVEKELA